MTRILLLAALLLGAPALAEEQPVTLKDAPGRDLVENNCGACHSLDYIRMNSPFPSAALWDAEVKKIKGELQTVYQLLGERFGSKVRMLASSLFVVMRNIADGIRRLLTAIVLAAVYTTFQPGTDQTTVVIASIVLLGLVMIIFTYYGGMEAVIWVEVIQLGIYIGGAIAAAVVSREQ